MHIINPIPSNMSPSADILELDRSNRSLPIERGFCGDGWRGGSGEESDDDCQSVRSLPLLNDDDYFYYHGADGQEKGDSSDDEEAIDHVGALIRPRAGIGQPASHLQFTVQPEGKESRQQNQPQAPFKVKSTSDAMSEM